MQSGKFTREIETDTMARCGGGTRTVMESFEDVCTWGNRTAIVSDRQHDVAAVSTCANPNSPAHAIVFPCVLQKILHNKRCVAFLSSHKKPVREFLFNLHVRRVRQRAEIIQPFIDQLAKI